MAYHHGWNHVYFSVLQNMLALMDSMPERAALE